MSWSWLPHAARARPAGRARARACVFLCVCAPGATPELSRVTRRVSAGDFVRTREAAGRRPAAPGGPAPPPAACQLEGAGAAASAAQRANTGDGLYLYLYLFRLCFLPVARSVAGISARRGVCVVSFPWHLSVSLLLSPLAAPSAADSCILCVLTGAKCSISIYKDC